MHSVTLGSHPARAMTCSGSQRHLQCVEFILRLPWIGIDLKIRMTDISSASQAEFSTSGVKYLPLQSFMLRPHHFLLCPTWSTAVFIPLHIPYTLGFPNTKLELDFSNVILIVWLSCSTTYINSVSFLLKRTANNFSKVVNKYMVRYVRKIGVLTSKPIDFNLSRSLFHYL